MKNNTAKRYLIIYAIVTIVFSITIMVNTMAQTKIYTNIINNKIAEIIGEIKQQYPETKEQDIIKILNSTENHGEGIELLEKYGITEDVSTIKKIEQENKNVLIKNALIVIVFGVIITIIFVIYIIQRKCKINNLDRYLKKVARKDYSLEIEDSSEDELNALKTSLYKIAILLKEEAENKNKQNEAILTSVSDISHQLKTFLASMQIILDNLVENKDMDDKTRERFLLEASKQIKGTNFLILSLLKLSKLDAQVVKFEKNKINLEQLINEILENLEVLIELKKIKVEKQINKEAKIIGDYNWNKEAIQNIIKNAIEHSVESEIEKGTIFTIKYLK